MDGLFLAVARSKGYFIGKVSVYKRGNYLYSITTNIPRLSATQAFEDARLQRQSILSTN